MSYCGAKRYLWGGFVCTLEVGHGGDQHVAEGRVNHRTGRAPVLATWPIAVETAPEDKSSPLVWSRTKGGGRHRATCKGVDAYQLVRVGVVWIVTDTTTGGIVGKAPNLDGAKAIAAADFTWRYPNGINKEEQ